MNLTPTRALIVALTALLASLLGACQLQPDECTPDDYRCDGDLALNCTNYFDNYVAWARASCGAGMCKLDSAGAFCALGTTTDPRCDASPTFCDGTAQDTCRSSYLVSSDDCGSANGASKFCVMVKTRHPWPRAMCASEPEPNPLCDATLDTFSQYSNGCDGNDSIQCDTGYVTSRTSCADGICRDDGRCFLSGDAGGPG